MHVVVFISKKLLRVLVIAVHLFRHTCRINRQKLVYHVKSGQSCAAAVGLFVDAGADWSELDLLGLMAVMDSLWQDAHLIYATRVTHDRYGRQDFPRLFGFLRCLLNGRIVEVNLLLIWSLILILHRSLFD